LVKRSHRPALEAAVLPGQEVSADSAAGEDQAVLFLVIQEVREGLAAVQADEAAVGSAVDRDLAEAQAVSAEKAEVEAGSRARRSIGFVSVSLTVMRIRRLMPSRIRSPEQ